MGFTPLIELATEPGLLKIPGAGAKFDKISQLVQAEVDLVFLGEKTAQEGMEAVCPEVDEELARDVRTAAGSRQSAVTGRAGSLARRAAGLPASPDQPRRSDDHDDFTGGSRGRDQDAPSQAERARPRGGLGIRILEPVASGLRDLPDRPDDCLALFQFHRIQGDQGAGLAGVGQLHAHVPR